MTAATWGGRAAAAWSAAVLRKYGTRCVLNLPGCTRVATEADHIVPRSVDPSLEFDVDNGRPACVSCNRKRLAGRTDRDTPAIDGSAFFDA